ncbi:hypothetical protein [Candidatus Uabimicrobium sp. HlEnr_7]|uniref:hypothetical protein n=1 Tax=Candidatus Uabimicrobium helgolandensis TaxID=3095367 RepID=UPI003556E13A
MEKKLFLLFVFSIIFATAFYENYGIPDTQTSAIFIFLIIGNFLCVKYSKHYKMLISCITPFFLIGLLLFPQGDYLQDVTRGREGIRPIFFTTFIKNGPNTSLLNKYLGHAPPVWQHLCPGPGMLNQVSDGGERVESQSLLRREYLSKYLKLLPSEEARKQVLQCLSDSKNYLRFHQGLLLACLGEWHYPQNMDSHSWWEKHAIFFRREKNVRKAASMVLEWKEKVANSSRKKTWPIDCQLYAMKCLEESHWAVESAKELGYELKVTQMYIINGIAKSYQKQPVWWK